MASKIFLDANTLLDLTLKREGDEPVKRIIELAIKGQITLFTSSSIIHIIGYWLTKTYGSPKAKELILALLNDVNILETNHGVTVDALQSKMTDIEDALQYHTGIHHKLDAFISRDALLQKLSRPALPVYSPQEFLKTVHFS